MVFGSVSNVTLMKIAALGGMATVTMGFAARWKVDYNIKQSELYKDALKTVRSHPGAVHYLGEPIKDGKLDIDDRLKNFVEDNQAKFVVPLYGSNQKGTLHVWATKENDTWQINRLELELKNKPDNRMIIKKNL